MNHIVVDSRAGFAAAVASVAPTSELTIIKLLHKDGQTVYRFKGGISEKRAKQLVRKIKRTPKAAFA